MAWATRNAPGSAKDFDVWMLSLLYRNKKWETKNTFFILKMNTKIILPCKWNENRREQNLSNILLSLGKHLFAVSL